MDGLAGDGAGLAARHRPTARLEQLLKRYVGAVRQQSYAAYICIKWAAGGVYRLAHSHSRRYLAEKRELLRCALGSRLPPGQRS